MAYPLRRSARIRELEAKKYADPATESEESSDDDLSEPEMEEKAESNDENEALCLCHKAQDDRTMICCDECDVWFHHNCVHLTASKVDELSNSDKKWYCPSCQKQRPSKKKWPKRKKKKKKKKKKKPKKKNRKRKRAMITISAPPKKRRKTIRPKPFHFNPDRQSIRIQTSSNHNRIQQIFTNHLTENVPQRPFILTFSSRPHRNRFIASSEEAEEKNMATIRPPNDSETDLEIMNAAHSDIGTIANNNIFPRILCNEQQNNKKKEIEEESDDDIEILAGDRWIGRKSFLENKESFKKDIIQKKKDDINKSIEYQSESDNDDDFVVLNKNKKAKQENCPLTLKKIINPIKNLLCSHVFERDAIRNYMDYLQKNNKPKRCPQGGCRAILWLP